VVVSNGKDKDQTMISLTCDRCGVKLERARELSIKDTFVKVRDCAVVPAVDAPPLETTHHLCGRCVEFLHSELRTRVVVQSE